MKYQLQSREDHARVFPDDTMPCEEQHMRASGTKTRGRRPVLLNAERGALGISEPTNTTVGATE